jgi:hypothetical protein
MPVWQSGPLLQTLPDAHLAQVEPQSTSVSVPFFTPSLQLGTAHLPALHTPLWQSAAPEHCRFVAHFGQLDPQSTSVSVWFLTPSPQVGS